MSLRTQQRKAYFRDPSKEVSSIITARLNPPQDLLFETEMLISSHLIYQDQFREAFGLPDDENPLGEVHAVLILSGQEEAFVSCCCTSPFHPILVRIA